MTVHFVKEHPMMGTGSQIRRSGGKSAGAEAAAAAVLQWTQLGLRLKTVSTVRSPVSNNDRSWEVRR